MQCSSDLGTLTRSAMRLESLHSRSDSKEEVQLQQNPPAEHAMSSGTSTPASDVCSLLYRVEQCLQVSTLCACDSLSVRFLIGQFSAMPPSSCAAKYPCDDTLPTEHPSKPSFPSIQVTQDVRPRHSKYLDVLKHVDRHYAATAFCASGRAARWRASRMRSMLWSLNMRLETTMPCSQKHRQIAVNADAKQGLQCHVHTPPSNTHV